MKELNLPAYSFKLKENSEGQKMIFDRVRKRFVVLTPEEWVRQHFVNFLVNHRDYPAGLLGVEVMFRMNELSRRVDIMVYNNVGNPLLAVECKAPGVKISGEVFDQVVEYNMKFRLNYLLVTNGISHSGCRIDWENNSYTFLDRIPFYITS
ncbi:MAG: type I restriction enzyme HsdR N-terminal domain-containing protein [Bacteroidales bacterium]